MAYKHVDESSKGDDYVIGHKRLQIDEMKAGFMGICGLLGAVQIWQIFNDLSKIGGIGQYLSYVGLVAAILWGLYAVIESSTIYYSETPCFSAKSVKLVYWVLFITTVFSLVEGSGFRKLYGMMEIALIGVILYLLYRIIKKALKKKNRAIRKMERG